MQARTTCVTLIHVVNHQLCRIVIAALRNAMPVLSNFVDYGFVFRGCHRCLIKTGNCGLDIDAWFDHAASISRSARA